MLKNKLVLLFFLFPFLFCSVLASSIVTDSFENLNINKLIIAGGSCNCPLNFTDTTSCETFQSERGKTYYFFGYRNDNCTSAMNNIYVQNDSEKGIHMGGGISLATEGTEVIVTSVYNTLDIASIISVSCYNYYNPVFHYGRGSLVFFENTSYNSCVLEITTGNEFSSTSTCKTQLTFDNVCLTDYNVTNITTLSAHPELTHVLRNVKYIGFQTDSHNFGGVEYDFYLKNYTIIEDELPTCTIIDESYPCFNNTFLVTPKIVCLDNESDTILYSTNKFDYLGRQSILDFTFSDSLNHADFTFFENVYTNASYPTDLTTNNQITSGGFFGQYSGTNKMYLAAVGNNILLVNKFYDTTGNTFVYQYPAIFNGDVSIGYMLGFLNYDTSVEVVIYDSLQNPVYNVTYIYNSTGNLYIYQDGVLSSSKYENVFDSTGSNSILTSLLFSHDTNHISTLITDQNGTLSNVGENKTLGNIYYIKFTQLNPNGNTWVLDNFYVNGYNYVLNNLFSNSIDSIEITSDGLFFANIKVTDNIHQSLGSFNLYKVPINIQLCQNVIDTTTTDDNNIDDGNGGGTRNYGKTALTGVCMALQGLYDGVNASNSKAIKVNMCAIMAWIIYLVILFITGLMCVFISTFGMVPLDILFGIFGITQGLITVAVNFFLGIGTNGNGTIVFICAMIFALGCIILGRYFLVPSNNSIGGGGNVQ